MQGLAKYLKWISPNTLTLVGIIPQLLFFYFMMNHQYIAAAIALAASCIDMLDGLVARALGMVTRFGGFLDSTTDRIADFLLVAGFYAAGLIDLKLAALLLLATYMISYVRSRAELAAEGKMKFDHGLIERPERIIFLLLVLVLQIIFPDSNLAVPLIWILTILSIFTFFQRVWHAYKKL